MGVPQIIKNFLNSEKAIASLVPLAIATVFVFTGKITYQEWTDFAVAITGIYVGGKSIQGAAAAIKKDPSAEMKLEIESLRAQMAAQDEHFNQRLSEKFKES